MNVVETSEKIPISSPMRELDNNRLVPELTFVRRADNPDPRLVELVRLIARLAARDYYEEHIRSRSITGS